MKKKAELDHVYFMHISLPSHSAEAKVKRLKPLVKNASRLL